MTTGQSTTKALANTLAKLRQAGQTHAACITITDTTGSSPRESGCKMLVTPDEIFGSIGGGKLEYNTVELARQSLGQYPCTDSSENIRVPLGPSLGQCCGGVVNILLEITKLTKLEHAVSDLHSRIYPSGFQIAIFGAGHVGQALVNILGTLPCSVRWIDSRKDIFPELLPANVSIHCSEDPEFEVKSLAPQTCFVVMTHSHQLDEKIISAILKRNDSSYCGLIGSRSKALRFRKRLAARGLSKENLKHLTCPIGDPLIQGKHPGEIALSLAGQLVRLHQSSKLDKVRPKLKHAVQNQR